MGEIDGEGQPEYPGIFMIYDREGTKTAVLCTAPEKRKRWRKDWHPW